MPLGILAAVSPSPSPSPSPSSSTDGQRVLLTGAAGFIGSHLAEALLARCAYVLGIDNFDPFYDRASKQRNLDDVHACAAAQAPNGSVFDVIEADIWNADAMRRIALDFKPHIIVHLAALAGVRPSIAEPARYTRSNVDGTVNLLEAARAAECPHIIFASSSSVYGNNRKSPFAEDDPIEAPISPYAATKRAAELLCGTYAHLFKLNIASLRFFTVYGPRQRPDLAINLFMRRLAAGQPIAMFGDGSTSRDYTFIDDIIHGILAAMDRIARSPAGTHRIWNLGSSSPITLRELIAAIAQVVGSEPVIEPQPMQPGDVDRTWADLQRSGRELSYQPRTSLHDGLAAQWKWMQSRLPS